MLNLPNFEKGYFETAIILCSRSASKRLPQKIFQLIDGKPLILHLVDHLVNTQPFPVILAIPAAETALYEKVFQGYPNPDRLVDFYFYTCTKYDDCPLNRMNAAADHYRVKNIIRVTHDKVFVDTDTLHYAHDVFVTQSYDYLYSSDFIPGTGFEIISKKALQDAADSYTNVEHISYAARVKAKKLVNLSLKKKKSYDLNLLVDYPEDLKLMELLISQGCKGKELSLKSALDYIEKKPVLAMINRPPKVTVYTCAFNAEKTLKDTMGSVATQKGFGFEIEYILIDDHSTDATCELMAEFSLRHSNVKWIRNPKNLGLASSSNIALQNARGNYLIRLDADDVFSNVNSVKELVAYALENSFEAVYPDNFFGDYSELQRGDLHHHVGGAIFEKKALNFLKFTDGLRNHDSLDIFVRARNTLRIGYLRKPMFFYTQRPDSMSRTNLEEREKARKEIESKHV